MTFIYHMTTQDLWDASLRLGEYRAPSLAVEGFIHASTVSQLVDSANRHFAAEPAILLLKINPTQLLAPIIWEASSHSPDPFPHLYGPLNLDAVVDTQVWTRDRDNLFAPPERR